MIYERSDTGNPLFDAETRKLSELLNEGLPYLQFQTQHVEPDKLQDGMLVFADGTNWNPGSGGGLYERVSSAWVKL
ncbi:MAG: hypothetical protein AAF434_17195 [Pseudomonadota bacterium]